MWRPIAVAKPQNSDSGSRSHQNRSKKAALREYLVESGIRRVDESLAQELHARFGPFTESYFRRTLRDFADERSIDLAPIVEGIRQESFEALERTLRGMARLYTEAEGSRRKCRNLVIEAKEHAQFAARRFERVGDADALKAKREMILWMRVWLDDPGLFDTWLDLRRREKGRGNAPGN
jgi:hypothetical protein